MGQEFDPYYTWLGIPPEDQPPHHYRLLGLEPLESDRDVIINAVNQRMAHVKTKLSGEHAAEARDLLRKVSAARNCLLTRQTKEEYDTALRHGIGKSPAAPTAPRIKTAKPLPTAEPLSPAKSAAPKPAARLVKPADKPATPAAKEPAKKKWKVEETPGPGPQIVAEPDPRTRPRRKSSWVTPVGVLLVLILAAAAAAGVAYYQGYLPFGSTEVATDTTGPDSDSESPGAGVVQPAGLDHTDVEPATSPDDSDQAGTDATADRELAAVDSSQPAEQDGGPVNVPNLNELGALAEEPWTGLFEDNGDKSRPDEPQEQPETPETTPADPQDHGPQRLPIPSQEAQDQAKAAVRRIFYEEIAAARTPAARVELAQKLFSYADQTRSDPAARYTLLALSRDLAANAGEKLLILQTVDTLAKEYQVNPLRMKADAFQTAGRSAATPQVLAAVIEGSRALIDQAVEQSRYDVAIDLADMCLTGARRLRSRELVAQCSALWNEVSAQKRRYESAQRASETIKAAPDDPEANLALGKYLVLTKRDWTKGLPHLARGSDERLADAANLELSKPAEPQTKIAIAELWLKLSAANRGEEEEQVYLRRAILWYEKALPQLESLEKIATAKKLEELGVTVNLEAAAAPGPKSSEPVTVDKPTDEGDMSDADLLDAVADETPANKPPEPPTADEKEEPKSEPAAKPTEPAEPSGESVEDFFGPRPPRPEENKKEGDFFGEAG
jgi:hypothetical protein